MSLYLISLTIIGVWGDAPADSGNCFTFYINIYASGALFRFVRGEGFAADPPLQHPTPLQNFEEGGGGGFPDPPAVFFFKTWGVRYDEVGSTPRPPPRQFEHWVLHGKVEWSGVC